MITQLYLLKYSWKVLELHQTVLQNLHYIYAPVRSNLKYYAACVHYLHIILSDKENNVVSLFEAETVEVWQELQSSLG